MLQERKEESGESRRRILRLESGSIEFVGLLVSGPLQCCDLRERGLDKPASIVSDAEID